MMEKLTDKILSLKQNPPKQYESRHACTLMDLSYFWNAMMDKAIELAKPYDDRIAGLEEACNAFRQELHKFRQELRTSLQENQDWRNRYVERDNQALRLEAENCNLNQCIHELEAEHAALMAKNEDLSARLAASLAGHPVPYDRGTLPKMCVAAGYDLGYQEGVRHATTTSMPMVVIIDPSLIK